LILVITKENLKEPVVFMKEPVKNRWLPDLLPELVTWFKKTMIRNLKNLPDNRRGSVPISNNSPTLIWTLGLP
jgi:hypothetical protein